MEFIRLAFGELNGTGADGLEDVLGQLLFGEPEHTWFGKENESPHFVYGMTDRPVAELHGADCGGIQQFLSLRLNYSNPRMMLDGIRTFHNEGSVANFVRQQESLVLELIEHVPENLRGELYAAVEGVLERSYEQFQKLDPVIVDMLAFKVPALREHWVSTFDQLGETYGAEFGSIGVNRLGISRKKLSETRALQLVEDLSTLGDRASALKLVSDLAAEQEDGFSARADYWTDRNAGLAQSSRNIVQLYTDVGAAAKRLHAPLQAEFDRQMERAKAYDLSAILG